MENSSEEYFTSIIKVEEEEFQQDWIGVQESREKVDRTLQESCRANLSEMSPAVSPPMENSSNPLDTAVTMKCRLGDCNWSIKLHDKTATFSRLEKHAKLKHKEIVDICSVCFKMFDTKDQIPGHQCNSHEILQCHFCVSKFYFEPDFEEHLRFDHNIYDLIQYKHQLNVIAMIGPGEIENSLKCHLCECTFFDYKMLNVHLSMFHGVTTDINMDFVRFETPLIRKLICNECFKQFTQSSTLIQHYLQLHKQIVPHLKISSQNTLKYFCNLCTNERVFSFKMLEEHYMEKHKKQFDVHDFDLSNWCSTIVTEFGSEEGKLKFSCNQCPDFYSTSEDLNKHNIEKHGEHLCDRCKVRFDTEKALEIHSKEVHLGECKFCDFFTHTFHSLHSHASAKHPENVDTTDFKSIYKITDITGDVYHKCSLCRKGLSSAQNMKMHYYWFHNRFLCDYCKMVFSSSNSETEHYVSNHLTECIHCNEKYSDSKELHRHLRSHLDHNYCVCGVCGESVKSRDELMEHIIRHKNAAKISTKHLCSHCGAQFALQNSLEQHIKNIHTKKDHNLCKICDRKYKNVTLHMFKAHGAVPQDRKRKTQHQCQLCDKIFYNFGRLKKHLKRHSRYKCPQCPMQFNLMVNLEQHVSELHTNRYAYSCTVCAKIFSSESDFNLHMKFHGVESKADLLPVLRCELCDEFCLNRDAMLKHVKSRHIKHGKLVNVKRKKPSGRPRYIKRVKK